MKGRMLTLAFALAAVFGLAVAPAPAASAAAAEESLGQLESQLSSPDAQQRARGSCPGGKAGTSPPRGTERSGIRHGLACAAGVLTSGLREPC